MDSLLLKTRLFHLLATSSTLEMSTILKYIELKMCKGDDDDDYVKLRNLLKDGI